MATGRPLFPGSTVKEELHLIFRLLGQSPALPQCDHQGATELCPAQAHKGTGTSRCACSQQGEDSGALAIFCLLPDIAPLQVALVPGPSPGPPPLLCLPRDPYRRDVARSDGPVRVPCLQLPPVPPPAAHQPRSQVTCLPSLLSCLWSWLPLPEVHTPSLPPTPPRPGLCQLLPPAGWTPKASTS